MKKYNMLTEKLPESVVVAGMEYPIRAGFRTGILFEELMHSQKSDEDKITGMLALYYPTLPENLFGAVDAAIRFFAGVENRKDEIQNGSGAPRKHKEVCSFSQDAAYIYAAFRQQYGIDLQRIKDRDLHWWEFLALFEALDDSTLIRKIMYYRSVSVSGMPAKERKRILSLKKRYRLYDDTPTDAKAALAKRNAEMKAYIQRRIKEVNRHTQGR